MSEQKRATLTSLGSNKKDKKSKESLKTVRFTLTLAESNEEACPEFNYRVLLGAAERRRKTEAQKSDGVVNGLDPYASDDEDKLKDLARQFEEKYGGGGRKRHGRFEDYVDLGAGYDENDPFIDNTDAYDEIVPEEITTAHGGFYINCGQLEFKEVAGLSDADDDRDLKLKKQIKRPKVKQTPLRSLGSGDTHLQLAKKRKFSHERDFLKKKKKLAIVDLRKKKADTVKDLLREKRGQLGVTETEGLALAPASVSPGTLTATTAAPAGTELRKPASSTSIADAIESVVNAAHSDDSSKDSSSSMSKSASASSDSSDSEDSQEEVPTAVTSPTLNSPATASALSHAPIPTAAAPPAQALAPAPVPAPTSSEVRTAVPGAVPASGPGQGPGPGGGLAGRDDTQLPYDLPGDLLELVASLKRAAQSSAEGKCKFFSNDVNQTLLSVEQKSQTLSCSRRQLVYGHLALYLPCTKDTLMKRAKKLRLSSEELKLKEPMARLEAAVGRTMPGVLEQYTRQCQKVAEEKSTEDPPPDTKAPRNGKSHIPRKTFPWNSEMRALLQQVVAIKRQCLLLQKPRKESVEELLQTFLEQSVMVMWPPGWMRLPVLLREAQLRPAAGAAPNALSIATASGPSTGHISGPKPRKQGVLSPQLQPQQQPQAQPQLQQQPQAQQLISTQQPHSSTGVLKKAPPAAAAAAAPTTNPIPAPASASAPVSAPASAPTSAPASAPTSAPASAPATAPATAPASAPASAPAPTPAPASAPASVSASAPASASVPASTSPPVTGRPQKPSPPPRIKVEPVQPAGAAAASLPPPPRIKVEPVQPAGAAAASLPPPPRIKVEPVQPAGAAAASLPPPPRIKVEPPGLGVAMRGALSPPGRQFLPPTSSPGPVPASTVTSTSPAPAKPKSVIERGPPKGLDLSLGSAAARAVLSGSPTKLKGGTEISIIPRSVSGMTVKTPTPAGSPSLPPSSSPSATSMLSAVSSSVSVSAAGLPLINIPDCISVTPTIPSAPAAAVAGTAASMPSATVRPMSLKQRILYDTGNQRLPAATVASAPRTLLTGSAQHALHRHLDDEGIEVIEIKDGMLPRASLVSSSSSVVPPPVVRHQAKKRPGPRSRVEPLERDIMPVLDPVPQSHPLPPGIERDAIEARRREEETAAATDFISQIIHDSLSNYPNSGEPSHHRSVIQRPARPSPPKLEPEPPQPADAEVSVQLEVDRVMKELIELQGHMSGEQAVPVPTDPPPSASAPPPATSATQPSPPKISSAVSVVPLPHPVAARTGGVPRPHLVSSQQHGEPQVTCTPLPRAPRAPAPEPTSTPELASRFPPHSFQEEFHKHLFQEAPQELDAFKLARSKGLTVHAPKAGPSGDAKKFW